MQEPNPLSVQRTRHSRFASTMAVLTAYAIALGTPMSALAGAGVVGEQVVDGSATFDRSGNYTTITASDGAIIHYERFDIAEQETVEFVQPHSDASVLNRVYGDPSVIMGTLRANGNVYLLNSAGIFIGGTAVVDVAGLYAVAGSMSNSDFLNNIDRFTHLSGTVENWGEIRGDVVALIGRFVRNHGTVIAGSGLVAMVAGDEVLIGHVGNNIVVNVGSESIDPGMDVPGVEQAGEIHADDGRVILAAGDVYSLAVRHPGMTRGREVRTDGGAGRVEVTGRIDASGLEAGETGGNVHVLGDDIVLMGAEINASGDSGGGEILVGGDYLGGGDIKTASFTRIDPDTKLVARAVNRGDGGKIIVWSDVYTRVMGSIDARGGAFGGNGGFIETSSANVLDVSSLARIDASAPAGEGGLWLLDPRDVDIVAGAADSEGSFDGGDPETYTPIDGGTGANSEANVVAIEAALDAGTDVLVTTTSTDGQNGDIRVQTTITKSSGGEATLTLDADRDIEVNNAITSTTGELNVALQALRNVDVNATIDTNGGDFSSSGVDFDNTGSAITLGGGSASFTHTGGVDFFTTDAMDLQTSSFGTTFEAETAAGAITVTGAITKNTGAAGSLTLTSADGITVNNTISSSSNEMDVDFVATATVDINADIDTNGGNFDSSGVNLDMTGAEVTLGGGVVSLAHTGTVAFNAADAATFAATTIADDFTATTSSGDITVGGDFTKSASGEATLILDAAGDVNVDNLIRATGTAGTDTLNVDLRAGGNVTATDIIDTNGGDFSSSGVNFDNSTSELQLTELANGATASFDHTGTVDVNSDIDGLHLGTSTFGGDFTATTDTGVGAADITVTGTLTKDSGTEATLTLTADDDVVIDSAITSSSDELNIVLVGLGDTSNPDIDINANIDTNGGDFSSTGRIFDNTGSEITLGGGLATLTHTGAVTFIAADSVRFAATALQDDFIATSTGGDITVEGAVSKPDGSDTSYTLVATGDIEVDAGIDAGTGTFDVDLQADSDTSGAGNVNVDATIDTNGGTFATSGVNFDNTGFATTLGGGTAAFDHTGTVDFFTTDAIEFAASSIGGDFTATSAAGAITVTGDLTKSAGADATLTLNSGAGITTDGEISSSSNELNVSLNAAAGSDVDVNADIETNGGDFSSSGRDFDGNGAGVEVTLGGGTAAFTHTRDVDFVSADAITFAATDVDRDLTVVATTGNIEDVAIVDVEQNAIFTTSASGADIDLGDLAVTGTVEVNTSGSGGDATVVNATALVLNDSNVGGDLNATATTGGVTDSGDNMVGVNATYTADQADQSIDIDDTEVTGTVAFNTVAGGLDTANASIEQMANVDLAASSVGSNLSVTSEGAITDAVGETVAVGGAATFITTEDGSDIDLDSTSATDGFSFSTLGPNSDVTVEQNGTIQINGAGVGGNFTAISNTGSLAIAGQVTTTAGADGITLEATAGNISLADVDGILTANSGGDVTIDTNVVTVADATTAAEIVATGDVVDLTATTVGATNPLDIQGADELNITDNGAGVISVREAGSSTLATTNIVTTAANTGAITVDYFSGDAVTATVGVDTVLSQAGTTGATSDYNVTVASGDLLDSTSVDIAGDATFTLQEAGAQVLLDNGIDVSGDIDIDTNLAGDSDITLVSNIALDIVDIDATGAVDLTSAAGVTVQNALGNGGNALASLSITGPTIDVGNVTSEGLQFYDGDVVLTRATTTWNVTNAGGGDAVTVTGTIDATGSAETLDIDTDGDVEFRDDIGAGDRLAGLSVETAENDIRFAKGTGLEQLVQTTGDITLNSVSRAPEAAPPGNRGTIIRSEEGDLTFDSTTGDITFGRGERVSVPGTLTITATDAGAGQVNIPDLTALEIDIEAQDVTLLLRDAGFVETEGGGSVEDDGVDIVANTITIADNNDQTLDIDITGTANRTITFGTQRLGVEGTGGLNLPTGGIDTGATGAVVQFSANNPDSSALTADDIRRAGDFAVLDGVPLGSTQQVLFVSGLIPLLPEPPDPPEVGPAPPKKEEVMAWMQCAQVEEGEEVSAACLEAGVGDFNDAFQDSSALGVLQLYRALVRSNVTTERIGPAFQAAIRSYQQQAENDQVLGNRFRNYLNETSDHRDAADYLEQFEFLFAQLEQIKMLPNDYKATRDELLLEILMELNLSGLATVESLGATFSPEEDDDAQFRGTLRTI